MSYIHFTISNGKLPNIVFYVRPGLFVGHKKVAESISGFNLLEHQVIFDLITIAAQYVWYYPKF